MLQNCLISTTTTSSKFSSPANDLISKDVCITYMEFALDRLLQHLHHRLDQQLRILCRNTVGKTKRIYVYFKQRGRQLTYTLSQIYISLKGMDFTDFPYDFTFSIYSQKFCWTITEVHRVSRLKNLLNMSVNESQKPII